MTVPPVLRLVDGSGIADLAGYLVRLLRYDRAAAVHLRAAGHVLATFGRVPFGTGTAGVLALRTSALAAPAQVDATVSAGQLLDALAKADDAATARRAGGPGTPGESGLPGNGGGGGRGGEAREPGHTSAHAAPDIEIALPEAVTGPPWTGLLPPRTGWSREASLPIPALVHEVAEAVGRFRARTEALPAPDRTRAALDRIAEDVWSKNLPGAPDTGLPLRAAHAAASLGFLGSVDAGTDASVHAVGGWLRLDGPFGSVFVRRAGGSSLFIPRR